MRADRIIALAFLVPAALSTQGAAGPEPIKDNSFLVEEAYNQEAGVVQHVGTFARPQGGDGWDLTVTQEWPLGGERDQLSFSIPLSHAEDVGTGVGDIALTYRRQVAGGEGSPFHAAPRLTVLVPSGSEEDGRGRGSLGLQAGLPLSYAVVPRLVTHWNVGSTYGADGSTFDLALGASAVWLFRPSFNVLLEAIWLSEEVEAGGRSSRAESAFLNPGIRWAHDFASGLQIVPGVAYTVGIGPSAGDDGLFLYLSFEHPFRRLALR